MGNPNSGKSTLFNLLTGLRQKISNYPGVTVEKKTGSANIGDNLDVDIIDFPGLYSLYPTSSEEKLVVKILADKANDIYPDLIIYVADGTNLERHMLLASQLLDLHIPMIFAINMADLIAEEKREINVQALAEFLSVPVIPISSRSNLNIDVLKAEVALFHESETSRYLRSEAVATIQPKLYELISIVKERHGMVNDYRALLYAHHGNMLPHLTAAERILLAMEVKVADFASLPNQVEETMERYQKFSSVAKKVISKPLDYKTTWTDRIDDIVTHRVVGPLLFFGVMLLIFQAMFTFASYPMDWIESGFAAAGSGLRSFMPEAWYTDLLVDGVLAGLGGVLVFIPQIAILFLLISILEETGYMSRAVYMFDGLMQRFGLSGRSIVSLVSSGACAIPAIISARTIGNWKERLNTILVSPLISCSARIPVYTVLVGFVVPDTKVWGIFNGQGLAFMGLYLLGIVGALGSALLFKKLLKADGESYLMLELPQYKPPIWKNAFITMKDKVSEFVVGAGKIIISISIVLWFLASYGPSEAMRVATADGESQATELGLSGTEREDLIAGKKIEASYAGHVGKFIEPAIRPLGFDWKIGIALMTSFAAREVFVGTMATIYSIGSSDDEMTVRDRMATQINPATGAKVYNPATALSLLIFYVFAMQCMSTLAVTKQETGSWKWPAVQFFYMGALAYFGSLLAYQLCS